MDNIEVRNEIVKACLYLKKTGLIARTWGNVSARINDDEFIITPSGMDYEIMKPEDLVICKISDCSYDKPQRKPSGERKVHANIYKNRCDVKYVVHTHQFYGSAICGDEASINISDNSFVPCADYGLPGTKKLANNCFKVFHDFRKANMFLMAKHGVVTVGNTMKQALDNAQTLEKECKKLFDRRVKKLYIPNKMDAYLDDYAQMFPANKNEDAEAIKMVREKNAVAMLYSVNAKPIGKFDHILQHLVYKFKYSKLKDKK